MNLVPKRLLSTAAGTGASRELSVAPGESDMMAGSGLACHEGQVAIRESMALRGAGRLRNVAGAGTTLAGRGRSREGRS
jgi:hypothetical protein